MTDKDILNAKREYLKTHKKFTIKCLNSSQINYLRNRFIDSSSLNESIYRIECNIEIRPVCKYCGEEIKWSNRRHFNIYCCSKCRSSDMSPFKSKDIQEKVLQTKLEKYGDKYYNNQDKIEQTKLEKYGDKYYSNKAKGEQTCLEKYGATSPLGNREIWELTRKHTTEKYGAAYNIEQLNKTLLEKYGVKWFTQTKKLIELSHTDKAEEKRYVTMKKNHTFNSSKDEKETIRLFKEVFPNILTNHKTKAYPFKCDIYIPTLDLYIECQYSMYHHNRAYLGTEDDKNDIEKFKIRSQQIKDKKNVTKTRYDSLIDTWVYRDVQKRKIAKENNLNYVEFWNISEAIKWLNEYKLHNLQI